jgi:hypothetical protein
MRWASSMPDTRGILQAATGPDGKQALNAAKLERGVLEVCRTLQLSRREHAAAGLAVSRGACTACAKFSPATFSLICADDAADPQLSAAASELPAYHCGSAWATEAASRLGHVPHSGGPGVSRLHPRRPRPRSGMSPHLAHRALSGVSVTVGVFTVTSPSPVRRRACLYLPRRTAAVA